MSHNLYDWIDNLDPPDDVHFAESKTDAARMAIGSISLRLSTFMDDHDIAAILDRLSAADPNAAHQSDICKLRQLLLCA